MDIFMDSYLRANLIAWLPIKKTDKVCYIGKPTDVIAKKLQELSDFTECVAGVCELAAYTKYDYLIHNWRNWMRMRLVCLYRES